jgi:hypothetical protein
MVKREVESQQVQRPSGLASIELLSDVKIFEILVVCPDLYRVVSSFKVMSPLLETSNDGKHLSIMYLIVSLDWIECFRQEGNQVPGIVIVRLLGENCSSSDARAVEMGGRHRGALVWETN